MKNLRSAVVLSLTLLFCGTAALSEISCGGPSIPIHPPSFTDNGNGTVTDNNTGYMWQKQDDGNLYNWYQASGNHDATHNPASQNVCGELRLGGHSDWRLPSKNELLTIIDYEIPYPGPKIRTAYFPNTKPSSYWSSTTDLGHYPYKSLVGFRTGRVSDHYKYGYGYVRCVRWQ